MRKKNVKALQESVLCIILPWMRSISRVLGKRTGIAMTIALDCLLVRCIGRWEATQRIIKPFADYAPVPNFFTPVCTGSIFSALFCLWVARLRTFGLLPIRVWQGAYLGAALITRFPSVYPHATWSFVVNARKVLKRMISWGNNAILWLPHINSLHPSKWTTGIHPHIRITKNSKIYFDFLNPVV